MKFLDRLQANFGSADLVDYSFRSTPRCCRPRLGMTATVCSELWPNNIWCTGSAAKPTAATAAAIDAKLSWRSSCAAFDVDVTRTYAVDVTDHNLLWFWLRDPPLYDDRPQRGTGRTFPTPDSSKNPVGV